MLYEVIENWRTILTGKRTIQIKYTDMIYNRMVLVLLIFWLGYRFVYGIVVWARDELYLFLFLFLFCIYLFKIYFI